MSRKAFILKSSCTDTIGVVAGATSFLADRGSQIVDMAHFVDPDAQRSFLRVKFEDDAKTADDLATMTQDYKETVGKRFGMTFDIYPDEHRFKTLIAVSKQSHCLNALLHRWSDGHIPIDIVGVVSNHDDQRALAEWYDLPYHHFPIEPGKKPEQEAKILALFEETGADLMVLARYMQILTPHACEVLAGRAINIHHSFLPGFKGARPYQQAYDRGVKLIGATAHYVTTDLDEGPIIEQGVERVDHTLDSKYLELIGQDIESTVLNRAIRWHAQHRVFQSGNRTVVLR